MLLRRRRQAQPKTIAQALDQLPSGWHVVANGREYVVVGPGGVFALNTDGELAQATAERLNVEIEQQTGIGLWVKPVAVRSNDREPAPADVACVAVAELAAWLGAIPGWLSLRQRRAIQLALDASF